MLNQCWIPLVMMLWLAIPLYAQPSSDTTHIYATVQDTAQFEAMNAEEWFTGCSVYCLLEIDSIVSNNDAGMATSTQGYGSAAHDFDFATAWRAPFSIGKSWPLITYHFANKPVHQSVALHTLFILNGYRNSYATWQNYARVKTMIMRIDGKYAATIHCPDHYNMEVVHMPELPLKDKAVNLSFEIIEVYPGKKYRTVGITELEFNGTFTH